MSYPDRSDSQIFSFHWRSNRGSLGKRRYEKHFISKLTDADGERQETMHWIDTAANCGYLQAAQARDLKEKYHEIGRMLFSMITKSQLCCNQPLRKISESLSDYFIHSTNSDEV